jgi:hypothetical protein
MSETQGAACAGQTVGQLSSTPSLEVYSPKEYREWLFLSQKDYCLLCRHQRRDGFDAIERRSRIVAITSVTPQEIVPISSCSTGCGVICKRACSFDTMAGWLKLGRGKRWR